LRVLVVAASLDIVGGQAVQAARLVEGLSREPSLEVSFQPINPRLPGALGALQSVKYVRTLATSAAYLAQLAARVPRFDVVHVFSASYFSFVLAPTPALLAAKLCGRRALLNYHSGEAEDHLTRWRSTAVPTARLFDAIAVPSAYLVEVFARFGLPARAVFNHVDTGRIPYRERAPLRPVFLSNRNLEPHYNVACVLRAFSVIQTRLPGARLTIAGDGSQRAALESLARELRLEGVGFLGRVAPERMPELYDAADVFLNASDVDNMPLSIIEAYAAGLPVVTTDAGGIPYIVSHEETGLLVPRGDHEALARAALRLVADEGLARRVAASARAECRKYSWEAVRGEWVRLYEELAGGEGAARAVGRGARDEAGAAGGG
jgi:glycosyltransferase involved in cell wall biosynthesis